MMDNDNELNITIVAVALGSAIAVAATEGAFDLWDSVIGLVLVMLLLTVKSPSDESQRKIYSLTFGLCFVLLVGFIIDGLMIYFLSRGIFAPFFILETVSTIQVVGIVVFLTASWVVWFIVQRRAKKK